nr:mucin-5AC-like [Cherax quadricarinatus]
MGTSPSLSQLVGCEASALETGKTVQSGEVRVEGGLLVNVKEKSFEKKVSEDNVRMVYVYGAVAEDTLDTEQFTFSHDVKQPTFGNFYGHRSRRVGDRVDGHYYILLPDRRLMTVSYYADSTGFHPTVSYSSVQNTGMFQDFLFDTETREGLGARISEGSTSAVLLPVSPTFNRAIESSDPLAASKSVSGNREIRVNSGVEVSRPGETYTGYVHNALATTQPRATTPWHTATPPHHRLTITHPRQTHPPPRSTTPSQRHATTPPRPTHPPPRPTHPPPRPTHPPPRPTHPPPRPTHSPPRPTHPPPRLTRPPPRPTHPPPRPTHPPPRPTHPPPRPTHPPPRPTHPPPRPTHPPPRLTHPPPRPTTTYTKPTTARPRPTTRPRYSTLGSVSTPSRPVPTTELPLVNSYLPPLRESTPSFLSLTLSPRLSFLPPPGGSISIVFPGTNNNGAAGNRGSDSATVGNGRSSGRNKERGGESGSNKNGASFSPPATSNGNPINYAEQWSSEGAFGRRINRMIGNENNGNAAGQGNIVNNNGSSSRNRNSNAVNSKISNSKYGSPGGATTNEIINSLVTKSVNSNYNGWVNTKYSSNERNANAVKVSNSNSSNINNDNNDQGGEKESYKSLQPSEKNLSQAAFRREIAENDFLFDTGVTLFEFKKLPVTSTPAINSDDMTTQAAFSATKNSATAKSIIRFHTEDSSIGRFKATTKAPTTRVPTTQSTRLTLGASTAPNISFNQLTSPPTNWDFKKSTTITPFLTPTFSVTNDSDLKFIPTQAATTSFTSPKSRISRFDTAGSSTDRFSTTTKALTTQTPTTQSTSTRPTLRAFITPKVSLNKLAKPSSWHFNRSTTDTHFLSQVNNTFATSSTRQSFSRGATDFSSRIKSQVPSLRSSNAPSRIIRRRPHKMMKQQEHDKGVVPTNITIPGLASSSAPLHQERLSDKALPSSKQRTLFQEHITDKEQQSSTQRASQGGSNGKAQRSSTQRTTSFQGHSSDKVQRYSTQRTTSSRGRSSDKESRSSTQGTISSQGGSNDKVQRSSTQRTSSQGGSSDKIQQSSIKRTTSSQGSSSDKVQRSSTQRTTSSPPPTNPSLTFTTLSSSSRPTTTTDLSSFEIFGMRI